MTAQGRSSFNAPEFNVWLTPRKAVALDLAAWERFRDAAPLRITASCIHLLWMGRALIKAPARASEAL